MSARRSKQWRQFRAHPSSDGSTAMSSRESEWWANETCRRMPQTHEELKALVRDAFDVGTRYAAWQEFHEERHG